jgi:two-component system, NarL family, nitrate/nitrite response regulator NarL
MRLTCMRREAWQSWTMRTSNVLVSEANQSSSNLYGPRTLSERDQHVIELVAQGLRNRDVAQTLGTTEFVIKNYLRNIYDKLGVWSRLELALWYEARRA